MKLVKGIYFPDSDTHFENVINDQGHYQKKQFDAALKYIKPEDRGLFIDIGAHVGLWSRMAKKAGFQEVLAFEPDTDNFNCLLANALCLGYNFALSDKREQLHLSSEKEDNSGAKVLVNKKCDKDVIEAIPFDEFITQPILHPWQLKSGKVLIKIDVQGYEAKVVRGMKKFIQEYKPIIIVEQFLNGKEDLEATHYCESLGMKILEKIEKEVILGW